MTGKLSTALATVKRRLLPTGDITERTVKGGLWVGAMNVVDRGLKIGLLVVLAPLLGPTAIGLVGISFLSISALRSFSDVGIRKALVQSTEDDVDPYLNTAFTLFILRGVVLCGALLAAAPYVAGGLGEPGATGLIRGIALAPLILGFRNPGMVYFRKDLEFHKEFVYRVSGSVCYAGFAIAYTLVTGSVVGIIVGYLADAVVRTGMTYGLHQYRPRPRFDRAQAAELVGYGKWITGSSITGFLHKQGDDAVIGWVLTATSLGYYQLAYRFSNAPATEIAGLLSNVMFPAYSKLQDDTAELRRAFFETIRLTSFITFPMSVGIFLVAPSFVRGFLGSEWTGMTRTMQILVVYGLLQTFAASFQPLWRALGRPDLQTKLESVRVLVLGVLIIPVTRRFGIDGVAALIGVVVAVVVLPPYVYLMSRTLSVSPWRFLLETRFAAVASACMGGVLLVTRQWVVDTPALVTFTLLVLVGIATYTLATAVLVVVFGWSIKRRLTRMLHTFRG